MSEILIIECDFEDGDCTERFDGFSSSASNIFKRGHLLKAGWFISDDKHYCPAHKEAIKQILEKIPETS